MGQRSTRKPQDQPTPAPEPLEQDHTPETTPPDRQAHQG